MRRKFGDYEYEVYTHMAFPNHWMYRIYIPYGNQEVRRECKELYDTEAQANFAAIGHISLLENGEE